MTMPLQPKKPLDRARYQRMRDAGFSDEQIAADGFELPKASDLPAAGAVDRTEQSVVRNPEAGPDPAMRGLRMLTGYAVSGPVGGVAGNIAARTLASRLGTGALAKLTTGAGAGMVGGLMGGPVGRATEAAVSGEDVKAAAKPRTSDAVVGGVLGGATTTAGELGAWVLKKMGMTKGRVRADRIKDILTKTAGAGGQTPDQMFDDIVARQADDVAVADVSPSLRTMGRDLAKQSPKAEQELEKFARSREAVPRGRVVEDMEAALGTPAANLNTTKDALREALRSADDARFAPLWEKHPGPILDPEVTAQVQAVLENVAGARRALAQEQNILLSPVAKVLQEMDGMGPVVTLQGLHRLKVMLDKAQGAVPTTGDQAFRLGALKKAADQLKGLSLKNLGEAGADYAAARAASEADRAVIDALEEGAEAAANGVTPDDVAAAIAKYQNNPKALEMYRAGLAGSVRNTLGGSTAMNFDAVDSPNMREKLAKLATSPSADATRRTRLGSARDIDATNRVQARTQPSTVLNESDPLGGQFGESSVLGNLLLGRPGAAMGSVPLALGSRVRGAATSRAATARREAADALVPLLTSKASKASADRARQLLEQSGALSRARSVRSGTVSGLLAGLLTGGR